ncbi:DUF1697 domain-containing protein [Algibacter sp. PT7-4]|uniref:DUF1697 domain-containing protein n=1 Tax=Algibacter ulvanivorans TaxID=3400999 RepID=UPI003AB010B3
MNTYIALLRGINVGGHKKVPMAMLREALVKVDLINVKTYIQSGNVIFQSSEKNTKALEIKIQEAITTNFGFEVPVLVLTLNALKQIFNTCPFPEPVKTNSYFMFLYSAPNQDLVKQVEQLSFPHERFVITNSAIYFHCSVGYGKAKCSNNFFEKKLKITATARNYKTMVKLLSLSA